MLLHQTNVVLFTTARTPERENFFKWAGPILDTGQRCVLIAGKDRSIRITSIADVRKYRIGSIRADYAEQVLLKMGLHKSWLEPASNMLSNLNKIQAGRIDLIAYTEKAFYRILETSGFNRDEFESVYLITEVFPCYAFSRNVPDGLVRQFQDALDLVKQGPEYRGLLNKYKFD